MPPPRAGQSRRQSWAGPLIASLAVALIFIAAGLGISMLSQAAVGQSGSQQPEASGSAPGETAQETAQEPLPAPEQTTIVAVLDPGVVKPAVNADEAVALARATLGSMVGESPSVQLVDMTGIGADDRFTGWLILSTDIVAYPHQFFDPKASVQPTVAAIATNTWVLVTSEGEVVKAIQNGRDET